MTVPPLHPVLVHLPIALVIFAPLFAAYVTFEIARVGRLFDSVPESAGAGPKAAAQYAKGRWSAVVLWAFLQTLLIYATMITGEQDADLVKASPALAARPEILAAVDAHENAAGLLLLASAAGLLAALVAWKPGPTAKLWRRITIGVQLLAIGVCVYTARLGGELVYEHGAAGAHFENRDAPAADAGPQQSTK